MYVCAGSTNSPLFVFSLTHTQLSGMGQNFKYPPLAKGFMIDGCHTVFPFLSFSSRYFFFCYDIVVFLLKEQTVCLCYEANLETSTFSMLINSSNLYLS